MPILVLIRHATNDFVKTGRLPGQSPNIHLNAEGREQADQLGKYLSRRPIAAVYSSHLERAIETAWRVAAPHGLAISISPDLADTNTGDFTGRTVKELTESPENKAIWQVIVDRPSEGRMPNGESMLDMQRRVVAALERICAAHPDPEPPQEAPAGAGPVAPAQDMPQPPMIAVVMHADTIKAALAHFLGMPFDNFQRLMTAPASMNTVMVSPRQAAILNVNVTAPMLNETGPA